MAVLRHAPLEGLLKLVYIGPTYLVTVLNSSHHEVDEQIHPMEFSPDILRAFAAARPATAAALGSHHLSSHNLIHLPGAHRQGCFDILARRARFSGLALVWNLTVIQE